VTAAYPPPPRDDSPASPASPASSSEEQLVGWLASLTDGALADVAQLARATQQARAVAAADPDALVELGFAEGFRADGLPRDPFVVAGVVVCAGARLDRSGTSHDCGFVSVGDTWVWEAPDLVADVVRQVPGPRAQMRSVSLLAGFDGLALDLVVSRARAGVHQARSVRSFVLDAGELQLTGARTPRAAGSHHR
jgi:hypothetical protein